MKKLLFIGIGSALMFTMGGVGPAVADAGPHKTTVVGAGLTANMATAGGGRCAACHRAHTAQGEMLLKTAQPDLCYSCHSSLGSSLDVVDGVENGADKTAGALRGGGFEYALIDGAGAAKTMGLTPGAHGLPVTKRSVPVLGFASTVTNVTNAITGTNTAVTSSHNVDGVTPGTMWGNGAISASVGQAGVTLECTSCHDPHGNGNYRILKPIPNGADKLGDLVSTIITPAVTTWTDAAGTVHDLSAGPYTDMSVTPNVIHTAVPAVMSAPKEGVNIPDALAKNYTTTDYWSVADRNVPELHAVAATSTTPAVAGVLLDPGATDGFIANVSQWCSTCHTRYLAGSGSYKTDSGDPTFTYRHRSNSIDKLGVARPNCIQCHVSHGSNVVVADVVSGTQMLNPGDTPAAAGDSKLLRVNNRGTCVMCHNV